MSKLSDLLNRRYQIARCAEFFNELPITPELETTVEKLKQQLQESQALLDQYHTELDKSKATVTQYQTSINDEIDSYVSATFDSTHQEIFKETVIHYELIDVSQKLESTIKTRISMYSSWKYPGLQIYPRSRKWMESAVSSDPLYLISHSMPTLKNIISDYPELYQTRLRLYEVVNSQELIKLPTNQFSLVFAWEFFNYLSANRIEKYIKTIFDLLRPGGVLIFSYNNCNLVRSAEWAELQSESYYTDTYLKKLCDEIGYQINFFRDEKLTANGKHISWAEIQKPGVLETVKVQPVLGFPARK